MLTTEICALKNHATSKLALRANLSTTESCEVSVNIKIEKFGLKVVRKKTASAMVFQNSKLQNLSDSVADQKLIKTEKHSKLIYLMTQKFA